MPRLSFPRLTKGEAIVCLLDLFWKHPGFRQDLGQIRKPYAGLLEQLAVGYACVWLRMGQLLSPEEYRKTLLELYEEYVLKRGELPELPGGLDERLRELEERGQELQPYLDQLAELAWKWKFRTKLSVFAICWYDILHIILETFKLPREVDVPLDAFDYWYPWPPPLPPLEIRVSSWAFVHLGRSSIESRIAKQLKEYEQSIRNASKPRERPSGIERHCVWWFKHYVEGKTYDEITQEEVYTPGGSLISHAKNVGAAVRKFSSLIDVPPTALKED